MLKKFLILISLSLLGGCAQLVTPTQSPLNTPAANVILLPQTSGSAAATASPTEAALPQESPLQPPAPNESPLATPAGGLSPIATPPDIQPLIDKAKNDLAKQLNVTIDQIQFVSYQAVDWPDASVGCPKPGESYIQAITPGYQISLQANGRSYEYHGRSGDDPFLCVK
jgi:hypothetical protein